MTIGIILALIAMLAWGFGDFFVEKSTRKDGDWETLFVISLIGSIVFLPFVYKQLPTIFSLGNSLIYLLLVSVFLLIATLLSFEGLKTGKISVIDPPYALEIPVAGLLSYFFLSESIKYHQFILIAILTIGLILVSLKSCRFAKKMWLEKGVRIALIGAIVMGMSSFLIGLSSRIDNPLLTTWFMSFFMALVCLIYLIKKGKFGELISDIKNRNKFLFLSSVSDNVAWVAYAFALSLAPMAIVVSLVECSIIINVLLGLYLNKEKLAHHQKFGLLMAIIAAIFLAWGLN
jgi:drug/metabolite transporter (DMT)-like permease